MLRLSQIRLPFLFRNLILVAGCQFLCSQASAINYYVDSISGSNNNDGLTPATAWQTIPKVNEQIFAPGDQVLFKRGCAWTGRLTPKGSGVSGNPIIFGDYGTTGGKPIINGGGASQAIALWDNRYITIQNFEITNDAAADGIRDGIRITVQSSSSSPAIDTFSGIKILNNDIHHVRGVSNRSGMYSNAAIYIVAADNGSGAKLADLLIEGNEIHDISCIGIYMKPAVYYNGHEEYWATNLVVRNNVIDRTGADLVVLAGAINPLIEYNSGYDAGINGAGYEYIAGMWTWKCNGATFQYNEVARTHNELASVNSGDSQAFDVDISTTGLHLFQYNYTHENEGGILLIMGESNPKNVVYRYNISVNDGRDTNASGDQFKLNTVFGTNAAYVYNNVVYSDVQEGFKVKDNQGCYYYNNIFDVVSGIYPSNPVFSNNCYYRHVPEVTDHGKIVGDPKFVGPRPTGTGPDGYDADGYLLRFKLQSGSPCIAAGLSITTANSPIGNGGGDFWGNSLYNGAPDIGVHELTGATAAARQAPASSVLIDNVPDTVAPTTVVYTGTWGHVSDPLFHQSTKSASTSQGSSVQVTFTGTNISLFGKKGPSNGKVRYRVDAGPDREADCHWPSNKHRTEILRVGGLPSGTHTLTVTMLGSAGVAIDYFEVLAGISPVPLEVRTSDITSANPAITYNPASNWQFVTDSNFYKNTRANCSTVGTSLDFEFYGTGVRLYGARAHTFGQLDVTVDGVSYGSVNCYNGTWPDYAAKLFEVQGLPLGNHTIRVSVAVRDPASGGGSVALDFFQVFSGVIDNVPQSSVVTYSSGWSHGSDASFFASTKSTSQTIGEWVEFRFTGTAVSLYAKKGYNLGRLNLSVDGGPVTTVDCYSSTNIYQFKMHEFTGLSQAEHTLRVAVAARNPQSQGNYIGIDYFSFLP